MVDRTMQKKKITPWGRVISKVLLALMCIVLVVGLMPTLNLQSAYAAEDGTESNDDAALISDDSSDLLNSSDPSVPSDVSDTDTINTDDAYQPLAADVWDGSVDISWYKDDCKEFHISSAAQLAGLAAITSPDCKEIEDNTSSTVTAGKDVSRAGVPLDNFKNKTVYLDCDIDLNNELWNPISDMNVWRSDEGVSITYNAFRGVYWQGRFEGNGHVIVNMNADGSVHCNGSASGTSSAQYGGFQGLFCAIGMGGIVRNLGIQGSASGRVVGGVAGSSSLMETFDGDIPINDPAYSLIDWPRVENCWTNVTVTGNGSGSRGCGGIVGGTSNGDDYMFFNVVNCYSMNSVSNSGTTGGLVGVTAGVVAGSYSTANVSSSRNYLGGNVGLLYKKSCRSWSNDQVNYSGVYVNNMTLTSPAWRYCDATHSDSNPVDAEDGVYSSGDLESSRAVEILGKNTWTQSGDNDPKLYWQNDGDLQDINLNGAKIEMPTSGFYNPDDYDADEPEVTVTLDGDVLVPYCDYFATYGDNGKYFTVTVDGVGHYTGQEQQDSSEIYSTVSFDANGGKFSDSASTLDITTQSNGKIAENAYQEPTQGVSILKGWTTDPEGETTLYSATDILNTTFFGSTVFYAQWEEKESVFAVYSSDDESLEFYHGTTSDQPLPGETHNGKVATEVYTGFESEEYFGQDNLPPWSSQRSNIKTVITDSSFYDVKPVSCAYWFYGFSECTNMDLSNLDTSCVKDMSAMFEDCTSLTSLNLENFNTTGVADMQYMFCYCSSLISLDLASFDTSNVTNMSYMFERCESLTSLDLASFNTSSVVNMRFMFGHCESLTSLDLTTFNTRKVKCMPYMFYRCLSLVDLDLSSFNTSNVEDMSYMFDSCFSLPSLNLSSFDTSNVKDMNSMFRSCFALGELYLTNFNTENVTNMTAMFADCSSLTYLNLYYFNTNSVTAFDDFLSGTTSLDHIKISVRLDLFSRADVALTGIQNWYDENGKQVSADYLIGTGLTGTYYTNASDHEAFAVYSSDDNSLTFDYGTKPNVGDTFHNKTVTAIYQDFESQNCADHSENLPWYSERENILKVRAGESYYDDVKPTYCSNWFYGFINCTSIDLYFLNTGKVQSMYEMFYNCTSATSINVSSFQTNSVINMEAMFYNCRSLTSLDLAGFSTFNVLYMAGMFNHCVSLVTLDLSTVFDTENVLNMSFMFNDCPRLISLDLSGFDTYRVIAYDNFLTTGADSDLDHITITDRFNLFTETETAITSFKDWYDESGRLLRYEYLTGFTGTGTYYTHPL